MHELRELFSFIKIYRPRIMSSAPNHTNLKKVSLLQQDQKLENDTIYIGGVSEITSLLRFSKNHTFFMIPDPSVSLPTDYHENTCVLFPPETKMEDLFIECGKFFDIQQELYELSHDLLEIYLFHGTLKEVLARTEQIIENPIMIIDKNYRVLCESGSESCGDIVWCENIKKGYCSYEFVTQFNQINEVRNIHTNDNAFMTGCLSSPLRRCICKLKVNNQIVGYLLSIELNSPFTELKIQLLSLVSRLVARMMIPFTSEATTDPTLQITNMFSDILSGRLKDKDVIENCLQYSNIKMVSEYYLVSVNIKNYKLQKGNAHHNLEKKLSHICDYILSACLDTNIVLLIESTASLEEICHQMSSHLDIFKENGLSVAVSDHFHSLENLSTYYAQTNFVHQMVRQLNLDGKTICTYDNLRIMDVITRTPSLENYLDLVGEIPVAIHHYDKTHNTEYFKTLYYYIRWSRNLTKAAEILCVHKNTVSYRIQRAKELFDLNLEDFHVTMHIYIGYLIFLLMDNNLLKHEGDD